jgi:hypothetical protein
VPSDPLPPRCIRLVLPSLTPEQLAVLLDLLNALHLMIWDAYQDDILERAMADDEARRLDDLEPDEPLPPS